MAVISGLRGSRIMGHRFHGNPRGTTEGLDILEIARGRGYERLKETSLADQIIGESGAYVMVKVIGAKNFPLKVNVLSCQDPYTDTNANVYSILGRRIRTLRLGEKIDLVLELVLHTGQKAIDYLKRD